MSTPGFPIRKSSDHRVLARSPRLIAGSYVLHRLLLPRHPPCALCSFKSPMRSMIIACQHCCQHRPRTCLERESIHRLPYPYTQCERTAESDSENQAEGGRTVNFTWMSRWPKPGVRLLKEVIQPQVPLRLPCYDFTPVANLAVGAPLRVTTSGTVNSHGVTGGVYKARERIHRGMLIRDY